MFFTGKCFIHQNNASAMAQFDERSYEGVNDYVELVLNWIKNLKQIK